MSSVVVLRVFNTKISMSMIFHFSQYLAILSRDSNCITINNLMKCSLFSIGMIIDFLRGWENNVL